MSCGGGIHKKMAVSFSFFLLEKPLGVGLRQFGIEIVTPAANLLCSQGSMPCKLGKEDQHG